MMLLMRLMLLMWLMLLWVLLWLWSWLWLFMRYCTEVISLVLRQVLLSEEALRREQHAHSEAGCCQDSNRGLAVA